MKFLVIGDPHFREGCVKDMELFIEEILKIVTGLKDDLDFVVVMGDVMDRHGILHQKPFHQSCRFLFELSRLCMTYCLIGNHDFDIPSVYLPENHPFKIMTWNEIPGLKIIDRPQIINGMFFTPYVPPGYFTRAVKEALGEKDDAPQSSWWEMLTNRGVRLGFAHQEFRGCQMGSMKSETGDEWPEDSKFGEVPFIISGHIHSYQMLGENIMYTGTPIQVNYGEGDKKGVCVVEMTEDNERPRMDWHRVNVPKKLVKVIPLEDLDRWVDKRFVQLVDKYGIDLTKFKLGKKSKQVSGVSFDAITALISNKDLLDELRIHVNNDRYLDSYKIQVVVRGKLPGVAVKNMIMRLKETPLSITHIYINEVGENKANGQEESEEIENTHKINWLEVLIKRLEGGGTMEPNESNPRLDMLKEILNDLTNKI